MAAELQRRVDTTLEKQMRLFSDVAAGDAKIDDVAAAFKAEGVRSLEEVLAIIREIAKARPHDASKLSAPIGLQRMREKSSAELIARTVHRVPQVPLMLNGELYDPKDITRFNGRELHFVPAASGDHMLVTDDRALMASWLQLSYLSAVAGAGGEATGERSGSRRPHTTFWEDDNWGSDWLWLDQNRGYYDLTRVGGLFANWNDRISSVAMDGTRVTVLHEHIHWTGSTLTLHRSHPSLHPWGWNDAASSLETW